MFLQELSNFSRTDWLTFVIINFQLSNDFEEANQKAKKAIDNVRIILIKFTYLCLRQVCRVFPLIDPGI